MWTRFLLATCFLAGCFCYPAQSIAALSTSTWSKTGDLALINFAPGHQAPLSTQFHTEITYIDRSENYRLRATTGVRTPPRVYLSQATIDGSGSTFGSAVTSPMPKFIEIAIQVQSALYVYGYYQGVIDGRGGPETKSAIATMQSQYGLPVTGTITPDVLRALQITDE